VRDILILIAGLIAFIVAFIAFARWVGFAKLGLKGYGLQALLLLAIVIVGFNLVYPPITYRYRLTLDVETPEGIKSGSSVVQVTVKKGGLQLNPEGARTIFVRGEAVAVDLGARGALFALLCSRRWVDAQYMVFEAFPWPKGPGGEGTREASWYYHALQAKRELPTELLPMLVRFRDINDPKTVEEIDPNNLAASFGPGVRLQKATIEMTKDAVTNGIEDILPWLSGLKGHRLDGSRVGRSRELANILRGGYFKRK
jgi:hypothetical protein